MTLLSDLKYISRNGCKFPWWYQMGNFPVKWSWERQKDQLSVQFFLKVMPLLGNKKPNQTKWNKLKKRDLVSTLFRTKIWSSTHLRTKAFPKHKQTGAQLQRMNVLSNMLKHTRKEPQKHPRCSSSILSNSYFTTYDKELQRFPLSHQHKIKMFNFW